MIRIRGVLSSLEKNRSKMFFLWKVMAVIAFESLFAGGYPQGFHFNRFSGPVSGPIQRVEVPRHNRLSPHQAASGSSFDYVAKPDYSFAYGVEDPLSGNYQNQREERDGDVVRGEYSVVDADGTMRRVTYTADPRNGFQATVHLSEPNAEHANQQQSYVRSLNQNFVGGQDHRNDGRYDDDY